MDNKYCVYESDKDAKWWRKVANILAISFTAFLMIIGMFGFRISRENRSLEAFRNANDQLRKTNAQVTEKLKNLTYKKQQDEEKIEELKQQIFKLKVENAALKAFQEQGDDKKM